MWVSSRATGSDGGLPKRDMPPYLSCRLRTNLTKAGREPKTKVWHLASPRPEGREGPFSISFARRFN